MANVFGNIRGKHPQISPFVEIFQTSLVRAVVNNAFSFWFSLQKRLQRYNYFLKVPNFWSIILRFRCKSTKYSPYTQLFDYKNMKPHFFVSNAHRLVQKRP